MARLRYNGLIAELGSSLSNSGTAVTFAAALSYNGGTAVPTITGTDYIPLSIMSSSGGLAEIVYLTAYTAAATTGTISRGKESTTGTTHSVGRAVVHAPNVWDVAQEVFVIVCSDETTAITTGTAKVTFRMPWAFTLTDIPRATLSTSSSSGNPTFDINEAGTTILGANKLSIDSGEKTSTTAATATTLADTSLADDAEMTVDFDTAGTGAKGVKIYLYGYRTAN